MIYDKISNFDNYSFGHIWKKAFSFLQELNSDSEEKRYELEDGMFAIVMSYPTKTSSQAKLESHKKYIDIQATINGAEGIEWFPTDELEVSESYNVESDATFYKYPGNASAKVDNHAGYFTVLWPNDAHMPQLKVDDILNVKKVVVKVPVELLETKF